MSGSGLSIEVFDNIGHEWSCLRNLTGLRVLINISRTVSSVSNVRDGVQMTIQSALKLREAVFKKSYGQIGPIYILVGREIWSKASK